MIVVWHNHVVVHRRLALDGGRHMWRTQVTGAKVPLVSADDRDRAAAVMELRRSSIKF